MRGTEGVSVITIWGLLLHATGIATQQLITMKKTYGASQPMIKKLFSYSNLEAVLVAVPIMMEGVVAHFLPGTSQKAGLPIAILIIVYLSCVIKADWVLSVSEAAIVLALLTIFSVLEFGLSRMLGMAPVLSWGEWLAIFSILPSGTIVFTLIAFLRRLRGGVEKQ